MYYLLVNILSQQNTGIATLHLGSVFTSIHMEISFVQLKKYKPFYDNIMFTFLFKLIFAVLFLDIIIIVYLFIYSCIFITLSQYKSFFIFITLLSWGTVSVRRIATFAPRILKTLSFNTPSILLSLNES